MRSVLLFGIFMLAFGQACVEESGMDTGTLPLVSSDSLLGGCLAAYELTENGDTINKVYGSIKKKHGHWVTFVMIKRAENGPLVKAKVEEGNYVVDKREGFWKQYNKDGTLRDSVEYKNDILVTPI